MLTAPNPVAHYHSIDTLSDGCNIFSTLATSAGAWPTANLAIYVPVRVRHPVVVVKLWVGSQSVGTGNLDVGIYSASGTRLVSSGSTAKIGSQNEQVVDVTDTTLQGGLYYLALSASNNTDTYSRDADAGPLPAAQGVLTEQLGSVTLPATATWAVDQTLAFYPLIGMLLEGTPA